jgi:hypothetical protein
MRFAISLEEIFSVELSDDVLEQAVTVADVVTYLCRHYFQDTDLSCDADEADDIGQSTGILIRLVDWLRRENGGSPVHRLASHQACGSPAIQLP